MIIQRLCLPNDTFFPLSHSAHKSTLLSQTCIPKKLVLNKSCNFWFGGSLKRVTKYSSRKYDPMFKISCGMAQDDAFYIRRCVELAKSAIGHTSPNPMVGCVIVRDGKIVGEGFHPRAGQPHAEVFALRDAGSLAENATAYVSLEPCNHYGRTPPCTEALIKAKVKKVVIGMVDPNPLVSSKGVYRLREAGIDVVVGVEEQLCEELNKAFIHKMLTGKPFVTLRYSMSVNGCLQDQLGQRVGEAGGYYSQLLQEYDAIVFWPPSSTEKFSFPASKEPRANQPLHIVIARSSSSPIQVCSLLNEVTSKLILFTDKKTTLESNADQKGIEMVVLDQINLNAMLEYCSCQGLCSVLLDLRGNHSNFEEFLKEGIEQNLLQQVVMEVLPLWDGCSVGNSFLSSASLKMKELRSKVSNESIIVEGFL